jgi:hypothetical protein
VFYLEHFFRTTRFEKASIFATQILVLNLREKTPTMTFFSAAAAVELNTSSLANGVYAYYTTLRLDVSHNANIAPSIVLILMAKMQLDEASITITDSNSQQIDNNDRPPSPSLTLLSQPPRNASPSTDIM